MKHIFKLTVMISLVLFMIMLGNLARGEEITCMHDNNHILGNAIDRKCEEELFEVMRPLFSTDNKLTAEFLRGWQVQCILKKLLEEIGK